VGSERCPRRRRAPGRSGCGRGDSPLAEVPRSGLPRWLRCRAVSFPLAEVPRSGLEA